MTQSPPEAPNRLQKAKNTLQSGKKYLGEAKNLKTSIKTGTTTALEGLFQSVKEAENERRRMEEVVKEKEERLAQYERIGIGKEGEESEKERKEKHEENEEIVKELKNRMEEWREKYMEKERKLREIEKEIEEFGMSCVECENKAVRVQRMSSDNYELRELQLRPPVLGLPEMRLTRSSLCAGFPAPKMFSPKTTRNPDGEVGATPSLQRKSSLSTASGSGDIDV
ncbi:hypothetical protein ACJJTC_010842 [Scirpophaga incertulas]